MYVLGEFSSKKRKTAVPRSAILTGLGSPLASTRPFDTDPRLVMLLEAFSLASLVFLDVGMLEGLRKHQYAGERVRLKLESRNHE
jgi:hypothetical protein